jgi:hypothetical protein
MALPAPATVDDLGLQGCLYLWALLASQQFRLPVAPTRRLTLVAMTLLREHGVIEVPWPEPRWPLMPGVQETPLENLQWRLTWPTYDETLLATALEEYLAGIGRDDFATAVRLRLWNELSAAETERYYEQQLIRHRLPGDWAQDAAFATRGGPSHLSLSQWRYCAWAAVRHGASLAMQHGTQAEGLRESIYQELRKRANAVSAWSNCAFPPRNSVPDNALSRGFTQKLTRLGGLFWSEPPSAEILLGHGFAHSSLEASRS